MPATPVRVRPSDDRLAEALTLLPAAVGIEEGFTEEELAAAERAAVRSFDDRPDESALPFETIDPEGSMDLDQALLLERDGSGYRFRYAIADVAAFVEPGDPLDAAARRRGQTHYPADRRIPLHPPRLSEGAASLLPDETRPAYLWDFRLDERGEVRSTGLSRVLVRSIRRWTYEEAAESIDQGSAGESLSLLPEIGRLRQELERERGGASLEIPELQVQREDGQYRLERRTVLPVEDWNAQLSLLTGMAAARIMLDAGVGILRTMPPAGADAVERFRRQTRALGLPWEEPLPYGEYLRGLDATEPRALAVLHAAASLFRGAAYTAFDGTAPEDAEQAAIAAPYAHVTAPLRRLVDRFALACCEAAVAGRAPEQAVRAALPELPGLMARSGSLGGTLDRRVVDTVEAAVLQPFVGEGFEATVLEADEDSATVQLTEPAVTARCAGVLTPGAVVRVRLTVAAIDDAEVQFEAV